MAYGATIKFPIKLIAFFLAVTASWVARMNIPFGEGKTNSTPIQSGDIHLPSGNVVKDVPFCYELYTGSVWSARKKDSMIVRALKMVLHGKRTNSTLIVLSG
jgi:hypothetical protein